MEKNKKTIMQRRPGWKDSVLPSLDILNVYQKWEWLMSSGVDVWDCHCCQCSTPKRLTSISRVEFLYLEMLWIRFSNLSESSWGWHSGETLSVIGGTFFRIVPFLIQFQIPCNVVSILASFLTTSLHIFWAALSDFFWGLVF